MTKGLASSAFLYAASPIIRHRYLHLRCSQIHHASRRLKVAAAPCASGRSYAQQPKPQTTPAANSTAPRRKVPAPAASPTYSVSSGADAVAATSPSDPLNPPLSTLPPPLEIPARGSESAVVYWFRVGRKYASFYMNGFKSVWYNYRAAGLLRERMKKELGTRDLATAVARGTITRSDFQMLARNSRDIGKLPTFALLFLTFGEWLPVIVLFVPSAVPGVARIPKQVRQMRLKKEERRRISFRQGVTEPDGAEMAKAGLAGADEAGPDMVQSDEWPVAYNTGYRAGMLRLMRDDQLYHLSSTLGLHSRLWDRVQLTPPARLMRRAVDRRFKYLSLDDILIIRHGGAARLTVDELYLACEERGLDVLGKPEEGLRNHLSVWLKQQEGDRGSGQSLLPMLFRRSVRRE